MIDTDYSNTIPKIKTFTSIPKLDQNRTANSNNDIATMTPSLPIADVIPVDTLINYHSMGFKLIPLNEQGIPNVQGLLSPTESQVSSQASNDGKDHPINYIHEYPEFWNEDRLRKESGRFNNVATTFGKTNKKDEDGSPLYLNALDIDSEQVYTTLSRLNGSDGIDFYFLDKACKSTFVSKTKKKHGLHIFWLSSKQHKPITSSECKPGCEFEIKTDTQQCTLPGSSHRNDPLFTYKKIGINEIGVCDGLYSELKDTLQDCLRPKNDGYVTEFRSNNNTLNINLSEYAIGSIASLLSPYYKKGSRDELVFGLSGFLHKQNISEQSVVAIIRILTNCDEEKYSRILTVKSTLGKDPRVVSGHNHFLSVLEHVTTHSSEASEIITKIKSIIQENNPDSNAESYSSAPDIANRLVKKYHFKTTRDNEDIYYYDAEKGVYVEGGESLIKEQSERINPNIYNQKVNEIIHKIKRRTYVNRQDFDKNIDIINLENGILNIWTWEFNDHSPNHLSLVQLPIKYDPNAKCTNILKFFGQVLHPCDVFVGLQLFGYILYRTTEYEKAFMLLGSGDNGKSVFIKLVEAFVGAKNASHVPLQELDNDKFAAAELNGKLVNTFSELPFDKMRNTGYFKALVSGDTIRAQRKYGHPFSYRSSAKLIFSTNKIPDSADNTYAYYKRWLLLWFENIFHGGNRDTDLINKLTKSEELSGLLNLALIGLKQLRKDGWFKDTSVETIREQYNERSNTVASFVKEKCIKNLADLDCCTNSDELYNEYKSYCSKIQGRPCEKNVFGLRLKSHGIEKDRLRRYGNRHYIYRGITLRSESLSPYQKRVLQ